MWPVHFDAGKSVRRLGTYLKRYSDYCGVMFVLSRQTTDCLCCLVVPGALLGHLVLRGQGASLLLALQPPSGGRAYTCICC
jgi:hypothetical protein